MTPNFGIIREGMMRSRDEEPKTEAAPEPVEPTADPPKPKTLEERVASLEQRLVPIIGPSEA